MDRHAAEAALSYIRDYMTIGLGSGKAIECLIEFIAMKNIPGLKICTNSMATAIKAKQRDLDVVPTWMVDHLDFTFDCLNFADKDLSGSKTDPMMLVENKLIASMADRFIVFVNKSDFGSVITDSLPVQVEVVKPAFSYASRKLADMGALVHAAKTDSSEPYISSCGNYILYADFKDVKSVKELNDAICEIPGVIETSLFTGLKTTALVYSAEGVETFEG